MSPVTTPTTGDLLYTEVEDDLRASVRSLLEKQSPWDAVLARTESGDTTDRDLWTTLARDVGVAGLAVPEEVGGAGASWREAAVVAEELGRAVAPVPFLGTAIATALLGELAERELLAELAAGDLVGALAVPFGTAPRDTRSTVELRGETLHGEVRGIADAEAADILLVPVADALYAVGAESEGLTRTRVVSLDMTRPLVDVTLTGASARRIASGPEVAVAVGNALRIGVVLLASEQLGVAERCLDSTVDYLGVRRQFGRILGSYQALKHRLADLWVLLTQARAVARYAAECAATGSPDLAVAAALAKAHCSVVVQQAAEECLQLHGGIGFTWEHQTHLYLKRAKSSAIALGTAEWHRAELGALLDLPGVSR
ncbi:acyl-CoA dehydrogenase family protein [Pseudonocardia sp. RS010]|uniref:acyl-CoA dehydrogenase family protein n=1 Tax=Pseudonocardia sp. RS010 TaxID=3385979 RepID=UPI0039A202C1